MHTQCLPLPCTNLACLSEFRFCPDFCLTPHFHSDGYIRQRFHARSLGSAHFGFTSCAAKGGGQEMSYTLLGEQALAHMT